MAEDRIHLQVVTAAGVVFDSMVSYVGVPLTDGGIGVLADHAPTLAAVSAGEVICDCGGARKRIKVGDGIVEIRDNRVTLLTQPIAAETE